MTIVSASTPGPTSLIPQELQQECLRYDMPTQFLMRTVSKEYELRGKRLKPGHSIMFVYPSATLQEVMRRMSEYRIDHSGAKRLRTEFVRDHLELPFEF